MHWGQKIYRIEKEVGHLKFYLSYAYKMSYNWGKMAVFSYV